jgi:MoxR-like ATPase
VPDLDDIRGIAMSILRHRVVLNFQAEAEGVTADVLVEQVLRGR